MVIYGFKNPQNIGSDNLSLSEPMDKFNLS